MLPAFVNPESLYFIYKNKLVTVKKRIIYKVIELEVLALDCFIFKMVD